MALFPDRKPAPDEMSIIDKYPLTRIFLKPMDEMYFLSWNREMDNEVKKIEKTSGRVFRNSRLHIASFACFEVLHRQGLLTEALSDEVLVGMPKNLICIGTEVKDPEDFNKIESLILGRAINIYFNPQKMKDELLEEVAAGAISGMLQIGIGLKDLSRHEADFVVRLGGLKPGDKVVFNN